MGTLEILQIIFIILKLCNVINWSWKIVLIPLWIYLGLLALYLVMQLIVWIGVAVLG